jgi:subtilisin family serine protease
MTQRFKNMIDSVYKKNIMIIAASGTDGKYNEAYPASYNNVVSVGAVDNKERLWSNSNYGPWVELTGK